MKVEWKLAAASTVDVLGTNSEVENKPDIAAEAGLGVDLVAAVSPSVAAVAAALELALGVAEIETEIAVVFVAAVAAVEPAVVADPVEEQLGEAE